MLNPPVKSTRPPDMLKESIILPFRGVMPRLAPSVFVAPGVVLIGDIEIDEETSIWPGCVLRGDLNPIRIGARCNLQDGSIVHVTGTAQGGKGTFIADDVTVGHMALLHDCDIGPRGFVGMRATLLDRSGVEEGGMLAAGALLTQGKRVGRNQMWAGTPAKYWRDITPDERRSFDSRAQEYADLAAVYRKESF